MIRIETRDSAQAPVATGAGDWLDQESAGCKFKDFRLARRFRNLLEQICDGVGGSIPLVCQDWANTKAAYRFLSNGRVNEADILSGHFQATGERFANSAGFVFVLHDTTEFSFQREDREAIGITFSVNSGRDKAGRLRSHTVCGILMHSSLAVTAEGLPLGLSAIKFWTRKKFKGTAALKKKIHPTRIPIEKKESIRWLENLEHSSATLGDPARCVHVGDRESGIYELFCLAQKVGTHFLVRTCVDRLAGDGKHTVADEMKRTRISGPHRLEVRDADGKPDVAILEIKYKRVRLLPPIGKQKRYPPLEATVIYAYEQGQPKNRKRIDWKLITDLQVQSFREAVEKLQWYSLRWKIELFHKILKSGCKAEDSKLRTAERLVNLISIFCIVSWRIFWMTMLNRTAPAAPPNVALTETEMRLLDHLVPDQRPPPEPKSLSAIMPAPCARKSKMIRIAALVLLALLLVLPVRSVTAEEVLGGAAIGTGAFLGGVTGRAEGSPASATVSGRAGGIIGAQVERRRRYYWRHGDCFRKVAGTNRRVSRRFCY